VNIRGWIAKTDNIEIGYGPNLYLDPLVIEVVPLLL
jgi:hypothetical protein